MTKNFFKETGIVIMLIITVVLLLGIIFYEYIPNNKVVPIKIQAYELPEDIQQELKNSISGEQNIVRTFYIDSSDLDVYETTKEYNKGKANPFADYSISTTTTSNTSSSTSGATNNSNSSGEKTSGDNKNPSTSNQTNNLENKEVYINTPGKTY